MIVHDHVAAVQAADSIHCLPRTCLLGLSLGESGKSFLAACLGFRTFCSTHTAMSSSVVCVISLIFRALSRWRPEGVYTQGLLVTDRYGLLLMLVSKPHYDCRASPLPKVSQEWAGKLLVSLINMSCKIPNAISTISRTRLRITITKQNRVQDVRFSHDGEYHLSADTAVLSFSISPLLRVSFVLA